MIVTEMLVFIHITNGSLTGLLGDIRRLKRRIPEDSVSHCGGGFNCHNYGKCVIERYLNHDRYSCNCQPGYLRPFCIQFCSKECNSNGSCAIERSSGKEFCICKWPYSGQDCSKMWK